MKTTIENYRKEEFEVSLYFSSEFKGRGGWNIICSVDFKGKTKEFKRYTTNSEFIDQISDMKFDNASYEEMQNEYKESFFDFDMEELILDWVENL